MARLPQPGFDSGTWGDILNEYLAESLKPDGSIKDNVVTSSAIAPNAVDATAIAPNAIDAVAIADGSITEQLLDAGVQVKLNANVGAPDWNTIVNKPAVIAAGANAAAAKATLSLAKADVGLGNVDNTSDATKNSASVTLSNKTIDTSNTIRLSAATTDIRGIPATKRARFDVSQVTDGQTRVLSVPDADITIVGTDAAQTLTNKALPVVAVEYLTNLYSGQVALKVNATGGSDVNFVSVQSAPSGSAPIISSNSNFGTDTNVDLDLQTQGSGVVKANGVQLATISNTQTLTNKRITPRVTSITSSATPTINTDNCDVVVITALATNITSMTMNLTGTPVNEQKLVFRIKDDGTGRTITWGSSFLSNGVATLLAVTQAGKTHRVGLVYDSAASKWICVAVDATGY